MSNQRAHFPNNPIVQHLLEVQRINNDRGAPAGRSYMGGGPVDAGIPSRVSSAAMSAPPPEETPLSPEERAERDRLAQELGILPRDEADNDKYASLDDAMAAGESVKPAVPPDAMLARRESVREMDLVPDYRARAMGGAYRPPVDVRSRLIDFKRVQSIDLMRGVAIVDDFEIALPEGELRQMKKRVLELAVDYVTSQLAEALYEVLQDGTDGKEGVQGVPAGASTGGVSPGQQPEGRTSEPVQAVRPEEGAGVESREETPSPDAGSPPTGEAAQ